jgi:2-dehydropantoate 2-reductase
MAATRIGILGAGAMGSVFGGLLAASDAADVWLVDRWREHIEAIAESGLRMTHEGEERVTHPHAVVRPEEVGEVDLLLVWAKSYDTAGAIDAAAPMIGPGTITITLQNGLGNAAVIAARVGPEKVLYGVTTMGGSTGEPGTVEVTKKSWEGHGMTWLGGGEEGRAVAALFESAGIPCEVREDIDGIVWTKLAMASPMSAVGGLTEMRVGAILDTPEAMAVVEEITAEIVAVADAKGLGLDYAEIMANNLETWREVREHPPSLLQDVYARRPTEVDALLGAVEREAEPLGLSVPAIRTVARLLTAATKDFGDGTRREATDAA